MRPEIKASAQLIINSYNGEYGKVDWTDCIEVEPFNIGHTDGYTCRWKDWSVICFRGSHGTADWIDNLTFWKKNMVFGPKLHPKFVKIHEGFKTQYLKVQDYLDKKFYNESNLLICGHSLGGALASICALDFKLTWKPQDLTCITWGSPRVGGRAWAKLFNSTIENSFRYIYKNDIVPKVPTMWMWFKHIKNKIHLNPGGPILNRIFGYDQDHRPDRYFEAIKKLGE
jgi:predicted lipase